MNTTLKLTKKQKKALAFRERKGKGKAKSFDDLDNDIPVEENQDLAEAELDEEAPAVEGRAGSAPGAKAESAADEDVLAEVRKGKKRKRDESEKADANATTQGEGVAKKTKKKRKGTDGAGVDVEGEAETEAEKSERNSKQRYILFVGNLKYTTTKEAVEQHFSKCDPPPTVRLMTPKATPNSRPTTKSKGCAFVEFTHRNALQQGLKLHQSELEGRKINVELTAGGGGKSERRLEKVKQRNKELYEQRKKTVTKRGSLTKPTDEAGKGGDEDGAVGMERPQRYSATSGIEQVPLKTRTWSVPGVGDEEGTSGRKRGSKKGKKRPPKPLGTGVNAIPVG